MDLPKFWVFKITISLASNAYINFNKIINKKILTLAIKKKKKGNTNKWSNYHKIALFSHASKVMLKILQARFQQYMNPELPEVQAGFRKGRGTRDQMTNIHWIIEKAREFQQNIHFCFIDYAKTLDCVYHKKPWKILKEMGIPDHLTCILRYLYAGQEATELTWNNELFPN